MQTWLRQTQVPPTHARLLMTKEAVACLGSPRPPPINAGPGPSLGSSNSSHAHVAQSELPPTRLPLGNRHSSFQIQNRRQIMMQPVSL